MAQETNATSETAEVEGQGSERSIDQIDRDVKAATRTSRNALIASLAGAIITSTVAAGSAIYQGNRQLDRADGLANMQGLQTDRQKIYVDFIADVNDYMYKVAFVNAALDGEHPEDLASAISDANQSSKALLKSSYSVDLVGSDATVLIIEDMVGSVNEYLVGPMTRFTSTHPGPYLVERIDDRWREDAKQTARAGDKLVLSLGEYVGKLLVSARAERKLES